MIVPCIQTYTASHSGGRYCWHWTPSVLSRNIKTCSYLLSICSSSTRTQTTVVYMYLCGLYDLMMTYVEVDTSYQTTNIRKGVSCLWFKTSLYIGMLHQWGCFVECSRTPIIPGIREHSHSYIHTSLCFVVLG